EGGLVCASPGTRDSLDTAPASRDRKGAAGDYDYDYDYERRARENLRCAMRGRRNSLLSIRLPENVKSPAAEREASAGEHFWKAMNFRDQETPEKLRGGFYTAPDIAAFLVRWVL